MKKTLVLGATDNPTRYAYRAIVSLQSRGHEVVPVSLKKGEVAGQKILSREDTVQDIDTVTLYVGTNNLPYWFDYILDVKPKRIIFNPGTENYDLIKLAHAEGIETVEGCTLVMLANGLY